MEAIRQGDIPGVQLRRRQPLELSPQELWAWLTEVDRLARWLADEAELEEEGILTLRTAGEGGEARTERGRTLDRQPPRLWVLAFERAGDGWPAATRLTLRVHARAGGAELDVLQEGFQNLPLSRGLTVWEDYRRRWRDALARLAEVAGG
jgi:uncharacterized protein YndB with AHSA1/START domain